ncbi:Uu.00g118360.m01.CDS01 [Anthostomella pinea]|uniref:Uu.00g118360.m01.CDS01 n=1 Tax=Anthostomella pinea TaxID=933095 RepID=A0AAI8YH57_9PEZI|nr:Uu.00g118360.m01.CDS01 [Anthostomella pinea]
MGLEAASVTGLTLRTPSASLFPHAALYVVQIIALALPPFMGRKHTFAGLIIGLGVYAHLHPHFTNDVGLAQPFSIAWSYYLSTLAKLLFSGRLGPEGKFWRTDRPKQEALAYKAFSWQKIRWALALIFNQRGVRWNHQVKNVPAVETKTKHRFLALQLWNVVKCLLVSDILFNLCSRLFYTNVDNTVVGSLVPTLRHPDWRWSFAKAFVFGAMPYFMLSMQYSVLAFVAVALGLSKPEDWPPPFGPLSDVTTIRSFWGKYWHQQLRHMLTAYTDAFTDAMGITRGTNWSSYTTLYLAFMLSGTFHALSQRLMPCPIEVTDRERVVGFFQFFVWQAAAITLEDFVQWCWRQTAEVHGQGDNHTLARIIGYVWVTCTIWGSLPLAGDTFLRMRMGEQSFLPFTLVGPFLGRLVPIPP